MEEVIEERKNKLAVLNTTVSNADQWLDSTLQCLGWTKEDLLTEKKETVVCPNNNEHIIPQSSLCRHMEACTLSKLGYTKEEIEKEQSSSYYYSNATTVIPVFIDEATHLNIMRSVSGPLYNKSMPLTMDRAAKELTPAERLAIYNYCITVAKESGKQVTIPKEELWLLQDNAKKQDRPTSYLERLAQQRDLKRRRQSYRAKNVHTTKKSHTEIIREVIQNQMEVLTSIRQNEYEESDDVPGGRHDKKMQEGRESRSKDRSERDSHAISDSGSRETSQSRHEGSRHEKSESRHERSRREYSPDRKERRSHRKESSRHRDRSRSADRQKDRSKGDDGKDGHKKHKKHKHKSRRESKD